MGNPVFFQFSLNNSSRLYWNEMKHFLADNLFERNNFNKFIVMYPIKKFLKDFLTKNLHHFTHDRG